MPPGMPWTTRITLPDLTIVGMVPPCPFYGRRVDRIRSVHPCSCPCEHLFLETTSAAPRHSRFLSSLRHFSPVSASRSVTIIHTRSRLSVLLLAPLSSLSPFLRRPLFWVDIILIAATLPITVRLYPAGCHCLDMLRNIGDITWVSHRKVGRVSDWNEIWTWESVKRPGGNLRGLSHLCHGKTDVSSSKGTIASAMSEVDGDDWRE